MATLSTDTDLARVLADEFIKASRQADAVGSDIATALALSELDSDAVFRCDDIVYDLNRSGVVVRHQADLIDGLDIDLTEFADELDQDPEELARQLQIITELGLGAEAGILPLVLWEGALIVPASLRDVFVNLPPEGEDPNFDEALARLDAWLFPQLMRTDDWDSGNLPLNQQRLADLEVLGLYLGGDTHMIGVRELQKVRRDGENQLEGVTVYRSVLEVGGHSLLEFIRSTFTQRRTIERLGGSFRFEDIVDILIERNQAEYQRLLDSTRTGGDKDQQRRNERRRRQLEREFVHLDRAALLAEFGELDWLGDVLLGIEPAPIDAESRALFLRFATQVGLSDATDFDAALNDATSLRLFEGRLIDGDPSNGKLVFNDEMISGTIEFGLRSGAIDDAMVADAHRVAASILGVDMVAAIGDGGEIDFDAEPGELDFEAIMQALALRVNAAEIGENQLVSALVYIDSAATIGDQIERLANVLLSFQTVSVAGMPVFTTAQWKRALGDDAFQYVTQLQGGRRRREKINDEWETIWVDQVSHIEAGSEQFNWIVDRIGVPGYHKKKWGRRRLHLGVDGDGSVAGFEVEKIVKTSLVGAIFKTVFILIAGYVGAWPIVYAMAAQEFADAARDGRWLEGLAAAAATILLASAGGGGSGGIVVATASSVAAGIGVYEAIEEGDVVAGVVAGARLIGFAGVAEVIETVDETVEAIEDEDWLALAAGAVSLAAGAAIVAGGSGAFGAETSAALTSAGETLDSVAVVAEQTDVAVAAIEAGDYAAAAAALLTAGAAAVAAGTQGRFGEDIAGLDAETQKLAAEISDALATAARTVVKVDGVIQAIENDDVNAAVTGALGVIATAATVFQKGGLGSRLLELDADALAAVDTIVEAAENGVAVSGAVDAARAGDVLAAIELLAARLAEVQGAEESLVGHYSKQLEELVGVLEVLVNADDVPFDQLVQQLIPEIDKLADALQPPPEALPLFTPPPPPPPPVITVSPGILPANFSQGGTGSYGIGVNGQPVPGVTLGYGGRQEHGLTTTTLPDGRLQVTQTVELVDGGQGAIGGVGGGHENVSGVHHVTVTYPAELTDGFTVDPSNPESIPDGVTISIATEGTGTNTQTGFGGFLGGILGVETTSDLRSFDRFQTYSRIGDELVVSTGFLDTGTHGIAATFGLPPGVESYIDFGADLGVGRDVTLSRTQTVVYDLGDSDQLAFLDEHITNNEVPDGIIYTETVEVSSALLARGKAGITPGIGGVNFGGIDYNAGYAGDGSTVRFHTTYNGPTVVATTKEVVEGARTSTFVYGPNGFAGPPDSVTIEIGDLTENDQTQLLQLPTGSGSLPPFVPGSHTAHVTMDFADLDVLRDQLERAKETADGRPFTNELINALIDGDAEPEFALTRLRPEDLSEIRRLIWHRLDEIAPINVDIVDADGRSVLRLPVGP